MCTHDFVNVCCDTFSAVITLQFELSELFSSKRSASKMKQEQQETGTEKKNDRQHRYTALFGDSPGNIVQMYQKSRTFDTKNEQ